MGRFNQTAPSAWEPDTTNIHGAPSHSVDPRFELASILLTSFVKNKFYESKEGEQARLVKLLDTVAPRFAAQAAVYARNEYGMRSITHIMAGELAKRVKGADWTDRFFAAISRRPDDMLEITAYYTSLMGATASSGLKLTNAMRRGFAHRLAQFDEYQLGKYRAEGKAITLVDLVNLVHPRGKGGAIGKLLRGELKSKGTFAGNISEAGREAAKAETVEQAEGIKSEAWGDLIKSRKIGYMALLKNLRNISQQAPQYVVEAANLLRDRKMIEQSLVLPFRFYVALMELQQENNKHMRVLIPALADACDIALANVPKFPGRTLIALDKSGSMQDSSQRSTRLDKDTLGACKSQLEMGSQFAAVLYKANDAALMIFDTDARYLTPNPGESTLTLQQTIMMNCREAGGTDFNSVFRNASEKYDRIIFISDEQHWGSKPGLSVAPAVGYREYCRKHTCRPSIFLMDTAGYGSLAFPESKVFAVAGFSEKVFELMNTLDEDPMNLVRKIEAVTF